MQKDNREPDGTDSRTAGEDTSLSDVYDDIIVNCFRYFGFTSIAEVDNMTPKEYRLLIKARKLKEVDDMYKIHVQAFANHRVKATKGKKQKPVYRRFDDFFNYEREIKKVLGIKNKKLEGISKIMKERRAKNG